MTPNRLYDHDIYKESHFIFASGLCPLEVVENKLHETEDNYTQIGGESCGEQGSREGLVHCGGLP